MPRVTALTRAAMGPYLERGKLLPVPLVPPCPALCSRFSSIFHKIQRVEICHHTYCQPSWTLFLHNHCSSFTLKGGVQPDWTRNVNWPLNVCSNLSEPTTSMHSHPPHCTVTAVDGRITAAAAAVERQERPRPALLVVAFWGLARPLLPAHQIASRKILRRLNY